MIKTYLTAFILAFSMSGLAHTKGSVCGYAVSKRINLMDSNVELIASVDTTIQSV
jgi:hypothetical protein